MERRKWNEDKGTKIKGIKQALQELMQSLEDNLLN